jgi:phospholipid-binding lipoprotein MlaA
MARFFRFLPIVALALLAACASPDVARGINDPGERTNRQVHAFNKAVDRNLLRPVAQGYGTVVPRPVRSGISNLSDNLSTPGHFVNDVLQGNIEDATANLLRFLVNTTFGFGGLLDVAGDLGIEERSADFGQTLHVWGVGEGRYMELPILGPSTGRDTAGRVVDLFIDPVGQFLPTPESYGATVVSGLSGVNSRYEFRDLIDEILYESADSYAQTRLLYLERRRFELGGASALGEGEDDPYADPYSAGDFGVDPYAE